MINKDNKTLPYLGIIFLALILILTRYLGLGDNSLWLDETFSATHSLQSPRLLLADHFVNSGANPPLYDIILHYWIKLWGTTEIAMRSLSATFSLFTVIPILSIGSTLFKRKIGVQVVVLYTMCSILIYFSHEVRAYQLFLLLSSSSIALFLKMFTKRSFKISLLTMLLSWLTLFTHPYGWLFITFLVIWWGYKLILLKRNGDTHLPSSIITLVLFIIPIALYAISFLDSINAQAASYGGTQPTVLHLAGAIHLQLTSFFVGGIAFFLIGKLVLKSKSYWRKNTKYLENVIFLTLWYCSFTFLPFIISLIRTPIFRGRYTVFSIIPLLFLLVIAIDSFSKKKVRIILFSLLTFFFTLESYIDSQAIQMEPWKEITEIINTDIPLVVAADYILEYPLVYYPIEEVNEIEVIQIEELDSIAWQERISDFLNTNDTVNFLSSHFELGDSILVDYMHNQSYTIALETTFTYRDHNNLDRHAATIRTFSKVFHEEINNQINEEL